VKGLPLKRYNALYPLLSYGVFHGGKVRPGRAADHSPPSSAAVMENYSYTSTQSLGHTGPVMGSLYLLNHVWIFTDFHTSPIPNFMEIRLVGAGEGGDDSADRQADTKKLKGAFRDYANVLKNAKIYFRFIYWRIAH